MKIIRTITFFSLVTAIMVWTLSVAAAESVWKIVIPETPNEVEKTAAAELQTHINLMTSQEVPIIAETANLGDDNHLLYVGSTKHAAELAAKDHPDPFLFDEIYIRAEGTNLTLSGHERRGALYAVYTFLEDICGCRWFTADVSRIPKMEDISFPADLNISYAPKLFSREMYNPLAQSSLFSARNKGNGSIDSAHGGNITILNSVHTFNRYISPEIYFDEHPDWFSEIDGKRTKEKTQLCLTNDEMREELTRHVLESLRKNPDAKFIDISQNDWMNFCTCEKCKAVDEEEGSHSGTLVRFLNKVAEDVEKEFPNVIVESLAYQYTRKPPKFAKPRDNIAIRLCTIECDFGRPLTDPKNADFMSDIEGWSKLANHLMIWDYVTNYDDLIGPHPNWLALGPNIRTFVEHHAIGLFEEGEGHDFAEMKNWVLMKLMWNPELDTQKLMADFSDGYYGEAATPFIMEYWKILCDRITVTGAELGCFFSHPWSWIDVETLNAATVQMNKASEAINTVYGADSEYANHLKKSMTAIQSLWITHYNIYRAEAEAKGIPFEGPADIAQTAKEFSEYAPSVGIEAPDLDTHVANLGSKWFESVGNGCETLQIIPMKDIAWTTVGSSKVVQDAVNLDGTNARAFALSGAETFLPKMISAEFRIEPGQEGSVPSCGFVFGADDSDVCSFIRLDSEGVFVANSKPGEPSHIIFHKEKGNRAEGQWHNIRILFRPAFISVYVDNVSLFQWLPYPAPDKKTGKIGFFAENGKVSVRNLIMSGGDQK